MARDKNISETESKRITDPQNSSRRRAVKTIASGVGALAAYHVMPVNWSKPIIEQVFLPAHAAVSGITLSDPCAVDLVSGNQESSIDVIRVSGFVTPPVGGLEVTIVATPNGGSGGPVTVTTTTASDGTYSAEVNMVGGPGIIGVGATTTVAGVGGAAHCSVGIPPADHPSANRPQQPAPCTAPAGCYAQTNIQGDTYFDWPGGLGPETVQRYQGSCAVPVIPQTAVGNPVALAVARDRDELIASLPSGTFVGQAQTTNPALSGGCNFYAVIIP